MSATTWSSGSSETTSGSRTMTDVAEARETIRSARAFHRP
jgi:hypothetical protein